MERLKRQLRQRFDAEEAELILEQESDALSLAVDVQTFEDDQCAIIDAALEADAAQARARARALAREQHESRTSSRLASEADALSAAAELQEREAEQERQIDDALHAARGDITVRAPRAKRRRVTIGSRDERSAQAERLIDAEEEALSIAALDQRRHEEHEEAVAQVAEQARREQAHIASLQLLREVRPRRYLLLAIRAGDVSDVLGCLRQLAGCLGAAEDPAREVNCCTPVWWAAYYGQAEVVRALAAFGHAALDKPCVGPGYPAEAARVLDRSGRRRPRWMSPLRLGPITPLTMAVAAGDEAVTRALLECGAAPDAGTYWDRWPLLTAVIFGHTALAQQLLAAGATADKQTRDGVTALWLCANRPTSAALVDLVRALVLAGADAFAVPRADPAFSWAPIVTRQIQPGVAEACRQSGCSWPRFSFAGAEVAQDLLSLEMHPGVHLSWYYGLLTNDCGPPRLYRHIIDVAVYQQETLQEPASGSADNRKQALLNCRPRHHLNGNPIWPIFPGDDDGYIEDTQPPERIANFFAEHARARERFLFSLSSAITNRAERLLGREFMQAAGMWEAAEGFSSERERPNARQDFWSEAGCVAGSRLRRYVEKLEATGREEAESTALTPFFGREWGAPIACAYMAELKALCPRPDKTQFARVSRGDPARLTVFDLLIELVVGLPRTVAALQRCAFAKIAHGRLGSECAVALPHCLYQSVAERLPGRAPSAAALRMFRERGAAGPAKAAGAAEAAAGAGAAAGGARAAR